jgi:hypothetical protein
MVFSFSQARAAVCSRTRASSRVLRAAAMTTMRAFCFRCAVAASSSFLAVAAAAAACFPSMVERLEALPGMVEKTMVVRGGGRR